LTSDANPAFDRAADPRHARLSAIIIAIGALLPAVFAIEPLWPFDAAHQTAWSRHEQELSDRFAAAHAPPRILFVGDSNVAFAIDGPRLSRELDRPVFTCTGHASLGLDVLVEQAITRLQPGDTVVLMPCLDHFLRDPRLEPTIRADWQRMHPELPVFSQREQLLRPWYAMRGRCGRAVRAIDVEWPELLSRWRANNRGITVGDPISPYLSNGLHDDGSVSAPRPAPAPGASLRVLSSRIEDYNFESSIGATAAKRMAAVCHAKGVAAFYVPGVRIESETNQGQRDDLAAIEDRISAAMTRDGFTELLPPSATIFAPALSYDTVFHLNDLGVAHLHERLLPALRQAITRR
jgi:hypothetical protein